MLRPLNTGQVGPPETAKILSRLKLAGIFNIVVGSLSLLWAILMLPQAFFSPVLARLDPEVPRALMIGVILVMSALSAGCGVVELLAGIKLLMRGPGARKLGLISGFVSCAGLWGCCIYPFCLAAGIFTLILLFKEDYRVFLERGEAVG